MLIPTFIDLASGNPDWSVFAGSQIMTAFVGVTLILSTHEKKFTLNMRQAFLLTNLSWIVIAAFGALPFHFSELELSYTDAFFESMSGITTTGSTVIIGLDDAPPGILFWRAILQWLGGVGILIMALSILPLLQVGGMQLFKAESLDIEKVMPSAEKIASSIGWIYIALTLACTFMYAIAGMSVFDAFAHGMTTIATGGFSTHDASIGYFNSVQIDTISIYFMLLGGLPFVLYLHAVRGKPKLLFQDSQVRWFLSIVFIAVTITFIHLTQNQGMETSSALRYGMFSVVSLITGTGYTTADYNLWGPFFTSIAFFMMCLGGCAGSTTCGIKIFRFQVLHSVAKVQLNKLLSPHGIFEPQYNGNPISESITTAVMSFFFLFALSFTAIAIALQFIGLDFITAMSASATAIANVGPALGPTIGPSGTFTSLPDSAKWILSFGMLLGRLELFTLLVMLNPRFWKY